MAERWCSDAMDLPSDAEDVPGLALRVLRRQKQLSLAEVATRTGVSIATISRFERGITASRKLAIRPSAGGLPLAERDVVLENDRLAHALGLESSAELRRACRAAMEDVTIPMQAEPRS